MRQFLLVCFVLLTWASSVVHASTYAPQDSVQRQDLFNTSHGGMDIPPYRIPGITVCNNGRLIASAARLVCGTDPGHGQVDIVCRTSDDNGITWSPISDVATGTGRTSATQNFFDTAFGDPAIVADRNSKRILIMAVAGCTLYSSPNTTRSNPNMIAIIRSRDNGQTWQEPVDITEHIYSLFDSGTPMQSAFIAGGRIFQSRIIRKGRYFRLYAGLCARPGGNRVIYSDDFGKTWNALGGAKALPIPQGDEPKCDELPDGTLVLSSRTSGGRYYNLFHYTDTKKAEGQWDNVAKCTFQGSGHWAGSNATNGELLIIPAIRQADGQKVHLALQSIPAGAGRSDVGIFWRELPQDISSITSQSFSTDWQGFYPVSTTSSAYSSMDLQHDGRIGFIYEETLTRWGSKPNPICTSFPQGQGHHNYDGFDNIYVPLTIQQITQSRYSSN